MGAWPACKIVVGTAMYGRGLDRRSTGYSNTNPLAPATATGTVKGTGASAWLTIAVIVNEHRLGKAGRE